MFLFLVFSRVKTVFTLIVWPPELSYTRRTRIGTSAQNIFFFDLSSHDNIPYIFLSLNTWTEYFLDLMIVLNNSRKFASYAKRADKNPSKLGLNKFFRRRVKVAQN